MLLLVGMLILLSPSLCPVLPIVVDMLWMQETAYNLHAAVYLAAEVKLHGCLDIVCGFVFENYLVKLEK